MRRISNIIIFAMFLASFNMIVLNLQAQAQYNELDEQLDGLNNLINIEAPDSLTLNIKEENELQIESWMLDKELFKSEVALHEALHVEQEEQEPGIEEWMLDSELFENVTNVNHALEEQKEESLNIETWMTDADLWNNLAK